MNLRLITLKAVGPIIRFLFMITNLISVLGSSLPPITIKRLSVFHCRTEQIRELGGFRSNEYLMADNFVLFELCEITGTLYSSESFKWVKKHVRWQIDRPLYFMTGSLVGFKPLPQTLN